MAKKRQFDGEKIIVTSILVLVTAALFLVLGYYAGINTDKETTALITPTSTFTPVANKSASTTATASATAPVNTANWKTYTNDKYGFSFKYPEDWTLLEEDRRVMLNDPENQKLYGQIKSGKLYGEGFGYSAEINVFKDLDDLYQKSISSGSSGETVQNFSDLGPILNKGYSHFGTVTNNSFKGFQSYQYSDGGYFLSHIIDVDLNPEMINISFNEDTQAPISENQILSTFQFTK